MDSETKSLNNGIFKLECTFHFIHSVLLIIPITLNLQQTIYQTVYKVMYKFLFILGG